MPDTFLLLQSNRIFKGVSEEDLEQIVPIFTRKYYQRGARICQEGTISSKFYLILSGQVRVLKQHAQGEEVELDILTQGAFFGDMPLLASEPRLTSIEVIIDTEVFEADKEVFENAIKQHTTVLYNLSQLLCEKLHGDQLSTQRKRRRVKYPIICIYGTEEHIGKSLVAVNLGVSLVQETKCRVLVLDMGMKKHGLASMLKIDPVSYIDRSEINPGYLETKIVTHQSMIDVISVAPDLLAEESRGRESIAKLLGILKDLYDYVIIDTSSKLNRSTFEAIDLSNMVLFITSNSTQEYPLMILDHQEVRMVLNLSDETLDRKRIRKKGYYVLPRQYEEIEQFLKTGMPVVTANPDCEISRIFGRIARDISEKRIGLALGGGSARGMAHIGVFQAFEAHQIPLDMIAGSSAGALIGSAYAAGVPLETIEDAVLKWGSKLGLLRLIFPDLFDVAYYATALGRKFRQTRSIWDPRFLRLGIGVFSGVQVDKLYRHVVGDPDFSDLKIPLSVVALDVNTGEEVVYDQGNVRLAVRASLSIPGIFTPLAYDGRLLIDGSIADPVPVNALVERGTDIIMDVNVTPSLQESLKSSRTHKKPEKFAVSRSPLLPPVFDIAMRSLQSLQYELSTIKTTLASVHITPDVGEVSWSEFFNADQLIEKGREAAENVIPQIQQLRWEN
ncbi:cyclic nucleotide-binding domain-containing protein [candidate division KSB3 bacterium]|uniref:Cyclic nucleotide-binding domain-containing protein n=1 Tax=candidate division KSB3 bacterium TaxID=2044937 RepID=A0A9D5JZE4_9BACT|nr:cyclic nucleotide-binding domain-containing protein [candidate division KSB3 bacterium]MBD3327038.1 cyclic nucleotide-binding domain-containing protein [candidate division KSB3 bacterium]